MLSTFGILISSEYETHIQKKKASDVHQSNSLILDSHAVFKAFPSVVLHPAIVAIYIMSIQYSMIIS